VIPNEKGQSFIQDEYVNELLHNQFLASTREDVLNIVNGLKNTDGVEVVSRGYGASLPLRSDGRWGVPFRRTPAE
jgi:hypothetical protein